jgi:dihydrodipicolinate synthase/N-acetylneuraminate lyase
MPAFAPGLVHTPVTPFDRDGRIDFNLYGRVIDFHIAHGADSLALPMHAGESVSLSDAEKRLLLEFAIKRAAGRVPVIAHASDAGTAIAAALARHAQDAGAAAVVSTTPYYWTPPPAMVMEHFAQIGAVVSVPFLQLARRVSRHQDHVRTLLQAYRPPCEFRRRRRSQPRLAVHDRASDGGAADALGFCAPRRH